MGNAMKQPLGKAGPGEVPKGERSMQTLPFTVGVSGGAQAELGGQMWLGSEAISFICWGEGEWGVGGEEAAPDSPGSGQYLFGRESQRKSSVVTQRILEPC